MASPSVFHAANFFSWQFVYGLARQTKRTSRVAYTSKENESSVNNISPVRSCKLGSAGTCVVQGLDSFISTHWKSSV